LATTELLLLRHGESEGNASRRFGSHGPTPLTALGRRQAEAAARAIAARKVDVIYVSDLPRAVETAAPLALLTGLVPVETPALRERSVGELTGLTFEEAAERYPEVWAALLRRDVEATPPGGESHRTCAARLFALLAEIVPRHAGQRVVLVSHGAAIEHLVRWFLAAPGDGELRFILHTDNCSIHRFQRRGEAGPWRILTLNDTSHLAGVVTG
jgi:broad specificity phosphatase PhoE